MSLVLPAPLPPPPSSQASAGRGMRAAAVQAGRRSFLRMVSHELRTPLNAVIGYSEIIARELHGPIGDPRYASHASTIRDSGLQLLALVNQVLDIARLEAGAMDLDIRPEPLDEVAEEALLALADDAVARGVRLVCEAASDAPRRVLADRRGLNTVLRELLSNAIAASPEGSVVGLQIKGAPGFVVLTVRDQGCGVDPAELPRLMRPFEQGESALVRRASGAGLGLPMARLLCRAMHGRLRLSASPGGGLVARVRLPLAA